MRGIVLRPEPGNALTVRRLRAVGIEPVACPLFDVVPLAAPLPALDAFDAVLLTSANAVRHGRPALEQVRALPVIAIGTATADAARDAGLVPVITGHGDVVEAVARARAGGYARLLHLAGRDHRAHPGIAATAIVYASEPAAIDPALLARAAGGVALLHSSRAAARFADLAEQCGLARASVTLAAISEAVAHAAGPGWKFVGIADRLEDAAVVALAAQLARALDG